MNALPPISLVADGAQLASFFDTAFRYADEGTFVSLRAFYDDRDGIFGIRGRKLNGDNLPLVSEIERFASDCAAASSAVVFCPPLATFASAEAADEKSLANGLALSVECDAAPAAARAKLEALIGPATVIVASGGEWLNSETGEIEPKLHLHWRLNEPTRSPEEHRLLKEARTLAARLIGGDPSNKPIVHPIRWPGSWHRKASPKLARIVSLTDHELDLAEALGRLQEATQHLPPPAGSSRQESAAGGEERDTAGLITAILTGDDYHGPIAALAMRYLKAGMSDPQAVLQLRGVMLAVPDHLRDLKDGNIQSGRWQARYDDISRAVASARAKIADPPPAAATPVLDPWNTLQPPSFPIECLPDVLRGFVEDRASALGADPCAIAWSAISACSAALDGRIRLKMKRHDSWSVPPHIWVALVGRVSAKKSPIIDAAWAPLQRAQAADLKVWQEELATWRTLPKNERGEAPVPRRRLVTHDSTPEALQDILGRQDRGIGVLRDELAGWIGSLEKYSTGRGGAADRAFFLTAFNGGPHVVDRVGRGTIPINNLALTLCGGIQPDRLRQFGDLTDDGLWQRLVPIVMHPASLGSDVAGSGAPREYDELIQRLLLVEPRMRAELADGAHAVREDVEHRAHDLEQSEVISAGFAGFCGKLHGLWGRLALVLSLIEPEGFPSIVSLRAAETARTLIFESALPNAARVYIEMGGGGGDIEATRSIAGFILIKRKLRVVSSDLTNNVRACRGQSLEGVQKLVSPLIAGGWLIPETDYAPTAWTVNQNVHSRFDERARAEAERRKVIRQLIVGSGDHDKHAYARETDKHAE